MKVGPSKGPGQPSCQGKRIASATFLPLEAHCQRHILAIGKRIASASYLPKEAHCQRQLPANGSALPAPALAPAP